MYNRDAVPFVDKDIETLVTVRDDLTGEELETIRDIIMQHLPDHYSDVIPWREGKAIASEYFADYVYLFGSPEQMQKARRTKRSNSKIIQFNQIRKAAT